MTSTTTRPKLDSPVSQLPPEILIRIFQVLVNDTLRCRDGPQSNAIACGRQSPCGPYAWIRVSHVCQQWRAVCLACPLLWSSITITHRIDLMQAMLERSRKVPLDVRSSAGTGCFLSRPFPMKSLRLVLSELHRICSVRLALNWWMYDDIVGLLESPAPCLRTFHLSTPNGGYDGGLRCPIVSVGNQEEPPQLEALYLNCYTFPWSDPLPFRTLKSLEIDNRGLRKPSIEEVAYTLGHMPFLVNLSLYGVLYGGTTQLLARARSDVIKLDTLEQLTLSGDGLACSTLLKLLSFPSTTSIQLDFTSDKHADPLTSFLDAVGLKLLPTKLNHLHLTHGPVCMLSFQEKASEPRLRLLIPSQADHLEMVCRHVQLVDSSTLHMTPYADISHWPSLFRHFESLTTLNLTAWQPTDVPDLLTTGIERVEADHLGTDGVGESSNAEGTPYVIFPSLHMLQLNNINFDGMARELWDALRARNECQLALDRLLLWNCRGLDEEDIVSLRQVVRELVIPVF
ncbi:hypothetical protein EIP86_008612 [Pleurotus ostreatoroseus]|nr:hypothetical protein EIP86_008612 [Pleurotus ostreatoroseus]